VRFNAVAFGAESDHVEHLRDGGQGIKKKYFIALNMNPSTENGST
jgi:hypothetical protein